jgi:hypothetical protein
MEIVNNIVDVEREELNETQGKDQMIELRQKI